MKRRKCQAALLATIVRFANNQSGQALREYGLIIAVIAVTAVTALTAVGAGLADFLPSSFDGLLQALEEARQQP